MREEKLEMRVRELESRPCPHVVSSDEGTQYCRLGEERISELEDQLRARQIDVNSAALSDAHKRIRELEELLDKAMSHAVLLQEKDDE
jgi:hypothetical protein